MATTATTATVIRCSGARNPYINGDKEEGMRKGSFFAWGDTVHSTLSEWGH
jgi:hypothetical protein